MTRPPVAAPMDIGPDTPLRLAEAAARAFPNGGMTAASLRREAARGHLEIERIAGKDFVTLKAIEEMRALCRKRAEVSPSGLNRESQPEAGALSGLSETAKSELALVAALRIAERLKKNLPLTSSTDTSQNGKTTVIRPRSKSPIF